MGGGARAYHPHGHVREDADCVRDHSKYIVLGVLHRVATEDGALLIGERDGHGRHLLGGLVVVAVLGALLGERLLVGVLGRPLRAFDVVAAAVGALLLYDGHELVGANGVALPAAVAVGLALARAAPRLGGKPPDHRHPHEHEGQR